MVKEGVILFLVAAWGVFGNVQGIFAAEEGHVIVTLSGETLKGGPCGAILEASGIGRAPQGRTKAQARLLAERAAKVRAYRNLVSAIDRLSPALTDGSGVVSTTGFIRGARIIEKSYLPDGRVKVKIAVDVHFLNPESACEQWVTRKVSPYGLPVYRVDRRVTEISEEDWIELNSR